MGADLESGERSEWTVSFAFAFPSFSELLGARDVCCCVVCCVLRVEANAD